MIQSSIVTRTALLSALAVCALVASGCGGSSTNGDVLGTTPAAGPAVAGANTNNSTQTNDDGDPIPVEVSGLVTPAVAGQPTAGDIAYGTTATAITVLSGQPPLTGVDSFIGEATVYNDGTANTASVPLGTNVAFRAYIINGQSSNSDRTFIPIKSVVLTSTDPEAVAAGFTAKPLALAFRFDSSSAGPFASATFSTATFPLPFTTNGAHTFSVTVADNAGQSTRTDFTVTVGPTPVVAAEVKAASKRR